MSVLRVLGAGLLASVVAGCPPSKTPNGDPIETAPTAVSTAAASVTPSLTTTAAAPTAALKGGWTVHLSSEEQSINPEMFDTPEKRAKVFFDHAASVKDGRLQVEHKTLKKNWTLDNAAEAAELDQLMTSTDWKKMKMRTSLEEAQEGGTIFGFNVTVGATAVELKTGNLDAYKGLKRIVELLKKTAGVP